MHFYLAQYLSQKGKLNIKYIGVSSLKIKKKFSHIFPSNVHHIQFETIPIRTGYFIIFQYLQ